MRGPLLAGQQWGGQRPVPAGVSDGAFAPEAVIRHWNRRDTNRGRRKIARRLGNRQSTSASTPSEPQRGADGVREKNVLRQAETGSDQRSPISESIDDGLPALATGQPILQRYAVCFNSERVARRPPRPASAESRTRAEVGRAPG